MSITTDEIASQPDVWLRSLRDADSMGAILGAPGERVLILGCGTSAFVAQSIATLRESAGFGRTDAEFASEWVPGRDYDRIVALSRSGTTSEVLGALRLVRGGITTAAVTGVRESPIGDLVDEVLVLPYADERSVVQTRFPTTTILLARAAFGESLAALPAAGAATMLEAVPIDVAGLDHFVYLGSGWTRGLADEAALKIREAAQAWSESYPLLDYRHGPIAVAHPGTMVFVFGTATDDLLADIRNTGATVVVSDLDPLIQLTQAQRIAVALAELRGLDPDTPRHLSRSVILA